MFFQTSSTTETELRIHKPQMLIFAVADPKRFEDVLKCFEDACVVRYI